MATALMLVDVQQGLFDLPSPLYRGGRSCNGSRGC
jgi:hypothetical protein